MATIAVKSSEKTWYLRYNRPFLCSSTTSPLYNLECFLSYFTSSKKRSVTSKCWFSVFFPMDAARPAKYLQYFLVLFLISSICNFLSFKRERAILFWLQHKYYQSSYFNPIPNTGTFFTRALKTSIIVTKAKIFFELFPKKMFIMSIIIKLELIAPHVIFLCCVREQLFKTMVEICHVEMNHLTIFK